MWSSPYSMLGFALSTRWAKGSVTILTAEPHGQPVMEGRTDRANADAR